MHVMPPAKLIALELGNGLCNSFQGNFFVRQHRRTQSREIGDDDASHGHHRVWVVIQGFLAREPPRSFDACKEIGKIDKIFVFHWIDDLRHLRVVAPARIVLVGA